MKTLLIRQARILDPSKAMDMVGDILVEDGKIAAQGTQAELLEGCPLYRNMWEAHISVKDNDGEVA